MTKKLQLASIMFGLALLATTGCANYTMRGVRSEPLPAGSTVGLAVLSHSGGGLFSGDDADMRPVLEDYMIAALVGRGFKPRTMRLDMLASGPLLGRLLAEGAYSNVSDLRIDINKNGVKSAKGEKPDASEVVEAAAVDTEEFKVMRVDVEPRNEMTEALVRYEAMLELAEAIHKKWKLDYMVFVHQFDDYSFAAHVVRLSDKTIVNSLIVAGNKKGLRRALGEPAAGTTFDADSAPVTHVDEMRFAEFFASKL